MQEMPSQRLLLLLALLLMALLATAVVVGGDGDGADADADADADGGGGGENAEAKPPDGATVVDVRARTRRWPRFPATEGQLVRGSARRVPNSSDPLHNR
ncbi:hypothetical protein GUJ93_ZPchr0007g4755 [Zizania palustris]|uniref:Uncharacterized protein n=1 Tax=Zizania palustris TaxID=103762 RepID=A0A8J5SPY4_ZIZPA|nr:hypothetical protein GUJ93_ZPchr0007g4755 [Zizania palustris]